MIKVFEWFDDKQDGFLEEEYQKFSECLKKRVLQKKVDDAKRMCIYQYSCLRRLLKLEDLKALEFSSNGKPFVDGAKFFSISNSENVICIAVSSCQVGVDLQKMIPYDERLAKRICSQTEYALLMEAKDKNLEITKLWTKKESFIKCKGETLGQDLKTLLDQSNDFEFCFSKHKDFVICECKKTL